MSTDNIVQLIIGAPGIISMLWLAINFYVKKTSQSEAEDVVSSLRKTVIDHDRRIIKMEGVIEALPKARDFTDLSEKISDVAGDVKGIVADIRSLRDGLARTERDFRLVTESMMPSK